MDQNLLPPLPSIEDLFAPSTSSSLSLTFPQNVNLLLPTPPMPISPSTSVPLIPPPSASLEHTGQYSPVPPQPTSPLVDRFDFQVKGNETGNSVLELEKSTEGVNSSQELLHLSPPTKRVRFSETVDVPSLQNDCCVDDSREEGEISDDTDDDVQVVTSYQKPPLSRHTVHRNEQTGQSVSHRRVSTDSLQNGTRTLHSSSRHHRQSHASEVTRNKSSHHSQHHRHRSHSSSKDASKSSHRHHHKVDKPSVHNTKSSTVSQKKPASNSDGQKQPDDNKHLSTSSSHCHLSNDKDSGRESSKLESQPSSSNARLQDSCSAVDTRKSFVDMDAPYSPGSLDVDQVFDSDFASEGQQAISHGYKTSSKIGTVKTNLPCLGLSSNTAQKSDTANTDNRGSSNISKLTAMNVGHGLLNGQEAVSHVDKTRSKIDNERASVPCSSLASNTAQNSNTANTNIQGFTTTSLTSILTAMIAGRPLLNVQEAVSHVDKTSSKMDTVRTNVPCSSLVSSTAQNSDAANTNIKGFTTTSLTSILTAMNAAREAVSRDDKTRTKIDTVRPSLPCSSLVSKTVQNREITNVNTGGSSTISDLTAMNVEDSDMEIDMPEPVDKLPSAEIAVESTAVDGAGQEYEIIDDLESNADEMDDNAGASSDSNDMELDSEENEPLLDKHVKPKHVQQFSQAARSAKQPLNNLKPCGEKGGDDIEAPVLNNKTVLIGESWLFQWFCTVV